VWTVDQQVLVRAARRWSLGVKGLGTAEGDNSAFTEVPEKLKLNQAGEADVDDFLWLMMLQWAKLSSWDVRRSASRVAWAQKHNPLVRAAQARARVLASGADNATTAAAAATAASSAGGNASAAARRNPYPPSVAESSSAPVAALARYPYSEGFLRQLMESIYRPGEGAGIVDPASHAAAYLKLVIARPQADRANPNCTATSVLQELLRDGVMWDVNGSAGIVSKESYSRAAIAVKGDGAPAHRLFTVQTINLATSVELSLLAAKRAYAAYNEVIAITLTKVG
jgi:hypothetical protein